MAIYSGSGKKRQRLRKGLLLVSLLAFPVTLDYFSPYLIIDAASRRIISGSFIIFILLFLFSLFLGRAWCGWFCPAGGMQELCLPINGRNPKRKKGDLIKWALWTPWMAGIIYAFTAAGGPGKIDFTYSTAGGISVGEPAMYIVYYTVIFLFLVPALIFGRKAGCRYLCWMAPFMIAGRAASRLIRLPRLALTASSDACRECAACTDVCPAGLDVQRMVADNRMEHRECTLCGSCADTCPADVIHMHVTR